MRASIKGSRGRLGVAWSAVNYQLASRLELLALLGVGLLYALNPLRYEFPTGYAGLYSLMTEITSQSLLHIPDVIPFYGPGGIPFAYPPLGILVAAVVVRGTGLPILSYLKWAPMLFSLASLVLLYQFLKLLFADRDKALVGSLLAGFGADFYFAHATAAGMVRALAMALAMAALVAAMKAAVSRTGSIRWVIAAALLLGLAAMTHLSYVVFAAMGVVLIVLVRSKTELRQRVVLAAAILSGAVVTAAPWLFIVLRRYGLQVLVNASQTHGTFGLLDRAQGNPLLVPVELVRWAVNLGSQWAPWLLAGVALVGIGYAALKGQWVLPIWMLGVIALLGETARFEEMLAGAMAANLVLDLAHLRRSASAGRQQLAPLQQIAFCLIVIGPFLYQGAKSVYLDRPALNRGLIDIAEWTSEHTDPEASLLLLPHLHSQAEWLPYLTKRTPVVAHWGAEWTGDYRSQQLLEDQVDRCSELQSIGCVADLLGDIGTGSVYLVVGKELNQLLDQIDASGHWQTVYRNDRYHVIAARSAAN